MDALALLLGAFAGLIAGGALAITVLRGNYADELSGVRAKNDEEQRFAQVRLAEAQAQLAAAEARLGDASARASEMAGQAAERAIELQAAREDAADLRTELAALRAHRDEERRAGEEKLELIRDAEAKLREAFESLSSDALRRNNQSFLELAKETLGTFQQQATGELSQRQQAIDELVRPIRESLTKVDENIRQIEKAREGAYASLHEQVRSMGETQTALQSETSNLVRALRMPMVRGRWGEVQLRRVVEMAGMINHCDFSEQRTLEGEDGRLRPDMIVRLAGGRSIVVDAKTPLDAYLSAMEAVEDAARAGFMKQHVRQVRDHVSKLGGKQYWSQVQPAPDLVVMFVPAQSFLDVALEHDPALFEYALEKRVMLASPANLIALLQTVAYGWRQEQVAEHAAQISELGRVLYERLCKMTEHIDRLRRNLDGAVDAYNGLVGSMETRVLVGARRFGELGVTVTQELPELPSIDRSTRALQSQPLLIDSDDEGDLDPDTPPQFLAASSG